MMGLGFYELSGGADFVPETRPAADIAVAQAEVAPVPFDAPQVSRAAAIEIPTEAEEAAVVQASLNVTPAVADVVEAPLDLRAVSGKRVNMRAGPGTNHGVLDTLVRGTQTEVIEVTTDGWARVRVTQTNQIGWMAERLLSEI